MRTRTAWLAISVAIAGILVGALQLFWGDDVGVADNGDGWRVTCPAGLRPEPQGVIARGVVFRYTAQSPEATHRCSPSAANPYSYRTSPRALPHLARLAHGGPPLPLRL